MDQSKAAAVLEDDKQLLAVTSYTGETQDE